jgi:hypothetical protein
MQNLLYLEFQRSVKLLEAVQHCQVSASIVISDKTLDCILHLGDPFYNENLGHNRDFRHERVNCKAEAVRRIFFH